MNSLRVSVALFFAVIAFLICAAFPVSAQVSGAPNIRPIGIEDFSFYAFRDPLLYSETAVTVNPAAAAVLRDLFVDIVVDVPYTKADSTEIRADDSIGQKGGTNRTADETISPAFSSLMLFPLKKRGNTPVLGITAAADLDYRRITSQKANFDSISQSVTVTDLTWPLGASLGAILASGRDRLSWGLALDYAFDMNLHAFRKSDEIVSGAVVTTWSNVINPVDEYTHTLELRGGIRTQLSNVASFGVALELGGGLRQASKAYRHVDADGDGKGEQIMTLHDWYLPNPTGTPAIQATGYDRLDRTWSCSALISSELRVALTGAIELFLHGTWRGLDLDYQTYYEHVSYPTSLANKSKAHTILNSGLASGEVMAGLAIGKSTDSLLKIGVGYRRIDERLSQNGVDAAGNNIYSYINPNNYLAIV